jgi:polycystin 2
MSFVFIGFFILLNMFMAIINQSYSKVKDEMAQSAPEFMLSDYLKLNYSRVVDKLNLRRNRILDIQEVLKSDEVSQKDELDFNLWRRELKKKGYADMEIEALFSRYDIDCDKKLNELEKIKLVRDIAKARSNLSQEFRNFKIDHKTATKKDAFEYLFIYPLRFIYLL